MEKETYKDEFGYLRFSENDLLVHREIYEDTHGSAAHRWVVHHVNGDKLDNRPENLVALHWRVHNAIHEEWPRGRLPAKEDILLWLRVIARFSPKIAKGLTAQGRKRKVRARRPSKVMQARIILRKNKVLGG